MVGEPCGNIAFGTVVTKRYMPFARVLAQSLREHHPDVPVTVVLVDDFDDTFDRDADRFTILPLNALGIPDLADVRSRYSGFQLTVVAKPYLLRHLLDQGFDAAVFLDADILVVDELTPLLDAIAQHAIVLTPHLLDSLSGPEAVARELNILQSGVCNGGCIAVSQSDSGRRFLSWFADRLRTHCCHDRGQGMHFDQRWLDLVPALFDDVHVLRDPGCNVAYLESAGAQCADRPERSTSLPVFPLQRLRPRPAVHGHQILATFHDGDPRSGGVALHTLRLAARAERISTCGRGERARVAPCRPELRTPTVGLRAWRRATGYEPC